MLGDQISAESLTISGTSALAGATPANAEVVKINATEAARFSYTSATSTASATTPFLAAGEVIFLPARAGWKVAGKTS